MAKKTFNLSKEDVEMINELIDHSKKVITGAKALKPSLIENYLRSKKAWFGVCYMAEYICGANYFEIRCSAWISYFKFLPKKYTAYWCTPPCDLKTKEAQINALQKRVAILNKVLEMNVA